MENLSVRDNKPLVLDYETSGRIRDFWRDVYKRARDKVGDKEAKIMASKVVQNEIAELTTRWED